MRLSLLTVIVTGPKHQTTKRSNDFSAREDVNCNEKQRFYEVFSDEATFQLLGNKRPAQSGILTDREVVSLFLHFTVNPKPRVEFIDRPRCCLRGKECNINRFQQVESRWGYSGTSDRIRFSVNRRIFVVGFALYGSIHGPTDYQVNIQIIHTDSNTVLGQNDTGFSCDGSSSTFRVMFKEPVEILPNVNYTACATLKGPDSHYGTKGLRKVIHESPTTGAKTCFTFCYAAGNNNGTSVEDGQIPEIIFYT
ncbi:BTB/POZ domain-containing protein 2-like [Eleutherodactylus coqui]|uniref:BTB/POZ domain-containing protein 2-like n=1 Tax=Eleutherodactylus coqui TaxID=57060 RepID=UPI003461C24E